MKSGALRRASGQIFFPQASTGGIFQLLLWQVFLFTDVDVQYFQPIAHIVEDR